MIQSALQLLAIREGKTTLDMALDNYSLWYNANQSLSLNKEYEITNGQNSKRKLTRADSKEVLEQLDFWDKEVKRIQSIESGSISTALPKFHTVYTVNGCLR